MKKFKLNPRVKLLLNALLGLLILQPLLWWGLQGPVDRALSVEGRIGVLIAIDLLAFIWFLQCRTTDKTEVKPKWW